MKYDQGQQRIHELNQKVEELHSQGKDTEALELAQRVCDMAPRDLGDNHPENLTSLNNLGFLLMERGDLTGAGLYLEKALGSWRQVSGVGHPETAICLDNLGYLHEKMGDLPSARSYLEQALEIRRAVLGEEDPLTAESLGNLGKLLHEMGELSEARKYLEEALAIRRRVLGEEHLRTVRSINNLAYLHVDMGDLAKALPFFEHALEVCRRVLGDDHPDTVLSLGSLGFCLRAIGDLAGARSYFERVLDLQRQLLGKDHPQTATTLNNLGVLLKELGDFAEARPYLEQALEIRRKVLRENHPDTSITLNNLGSLLQNMGDLAAAKPYKEEALAIQRRVLGEDHPIYATTLNNLGYLFQEMSDLYGARLCYEQALAIHRRVLGEYHPETALSVTNLGTLEVASRRIEEAFALFRHATVIDDRIINQVFSIASDQQRLLVISRRQDNQNLLLSFVIQDLHGSTVGVRICFDLVLRRKALGAEALASQRDAVLSGRYPYLREAFNHLTQIRRRIAQKTLSGPTSGETLMAHEQTLHQWQQEQQQRETKLARQIPEVNLEQQLLKAECRAVALGLPEGVALVEFVRFDVFDFHAVPAHGEPRWQPARYLAFVLLGGHPDQLEMLDLGEADPIDRMIADFRGSVALDPRDRFERDLRRCRPGASPVLQEQPGPVLRAAVFDKLVPALAGCKRLFLAPDGDLTRLPFEVLPDAQGRFLLEQYQISYLSCGRDVLRFGAARSGQPTEPLVVADPLFDLIADTDPSLPPAAIRSRCSRDFKKSDYHFPRLPGTREEGERVGALLGVRPWLESAALEARLKERRSPRVLHLATHGFFLTDQEGNPNKESRALEMLGGEAGSFGRLSGPLPENPLLRSGLALAGAQTWLDGKPLPPEAEDGLLTAEDVAGLDLLNTELVVLSACETGLGEVHTGEGVFGLRRSFIVAGARTLVMSLWKVPDEQTRDLMIDFHTRVLSGQGVADALRQAQLAMREKYPDPYFWGAFICHGNPGPLAGV